MWGPLWLQMSLALLWSLLSLPLAGWAWLAYQRWQRLFSDENLQKGNELAISRVALFTLVGLLTMFVFAGVLTLGMAWAMNGLASLSWRPDPAAEYFERPRWSFYILISLLPAIVLSVAPLDAFGRSVYKSTFSHLLVRSSMGGSSVRQARAGLVGLRWLVFIVWVGSALLFAGSLRWFTLVGTESIVVGRPLHGSPFVVKPSEIEAVYGVDSFTAPAGNVVARYHPVIELRHGDHIDFSDEAGGETRRLADVLEAWAGRRGLPFVRIPAYSGR